MSEIKALSKLDIIYQDIIDNWTYFENTDDAFNSEVFQNRVKLIITNSENAVHMVNILELFSKNEEIDEISTPSIKYLLLPAYQGYFSMKKMSDDRYEIIKIAQTYYVEFLKLIKLYNLTSLKIPKLVGNEETDNTTLNTSQITRRDEEKRNEKIQRFKRKKERDNKLKEMEAVISAKKSDEEFERDYYFELIDSWVDTSFEEIDSIEKELEILQYMKQMKKNGTDTSVQVKSNTVDREKKKFVPFILTRDKLEAAVIGAGYPSLPTYTIEEWFDNTYGNLSDKSSNGNNNSNTANTSNKEIEDENNIEADDQEYLDKTRKMDDWKDDHRTGWGNRYNRS